MEIGVTVQKIFSGGSLDQESLVESMTKLEKRRNTYLAERRARSRLKGIHSEEYNGLVSEELIKIWEEEIRDGKLA